MKTEHSIFKKQLNQLKVDFLERLEQEKRYSSHTVLAYQRDIDDFIAYLTRQNQFSDLQITDCKAYIQSLDLDPRSISRKLASLRSFWQYLIHINVCQINLWQSIKTPKNIRKIPALLDDAQMIRFLDQLPNETPIDIRNKTIFECLYSSGIRVSECTQLSLDDIDSASKTLLIHGKGNKERLALVGNSFMIQYERYLSIRPLLNKHGHNWVFLSHTGNVLNSRDIQRMLKPYLAHLSSDFTPHSFRHSYASSLINNGADLRTVQELLGHSSIGSTQIYTQISEKRLKDSYYHAHPRA